MADKQNDTGTGTGGGKTPRKPVPSPLERLRAERRGRARDDDAVDLGATTERDVDARRGARAFGFDDIPVGRVDDLSDLNLHRAGGGSVDGVSGDAATGDAEDLASFDTITDSNSLTSAALIEGAFRGDDKPASVQDTTRANRAAAQDPRQDDPGVGWMSEDDERVDVREARGVPVDGTRAGAAFHDGEGTDQVVRAEDGPALGMTDRPDDETVDAYVREERKARARGRDGRKGGAPDEGGRGGAPLH